VTVVSPPELPGASEALELAVNTFAWYAGEVWALCDDDLLSPETMVTSGESAAFVTYPARCVRAAELLSLFVLLLERNSDPREHDVEDYLLRFVRDQHGTAHPISDNWAASLIPIGLVVGRRDGNLLDDWLTEITRWITRFYGDQEGLAAIDASEDDEVAHLLGGPLESVSLRRRQSSLLATAVLDLAAVFERGELFDLLRNEFLAVGVIPEVVQAADDAGLYRRDGEGVAKTWNDTYEDTGTPRDSWKVAAHHLQSPEAYSLDREGRSWELLAISAVLRDRWFLPSMRNIAKL